MITILAVKSR